MYYPQTRVPYRPNRGVPLVWMYLFYLVLFVLVRNVNLTFSVSATEIRHFWNIRNHLPWRADGRTDGRIFRRPEKNKKISCRNRVFLLYIWTSYRESSSLLMSSTFYTQLFKLSWQEVSIFCCLVMKPELSSHLISFFLIIEPNVLYFFIF